MHNEAFCMVLLTDMVKIGRSRNDLLAIYSAVFKR